MISIEPKLRKTLVGLRKGEELRLVFTFYCREKEEGD